MSDNSSHNALPLDQQQPGVSIYDTTTHEDEAMDMGDQMEDMVDELTASMRPNRLAPTISITTASSVDSDTTLIQQQQSSSSAMDMDPPAASDAQTRLRRLILEVQADPSLTPLERARKIQTLMTSQYMASQQIKTVGGEPKSLRTATSMMSTAVHALTGSEQEAQEGSGDAAGGPPMMALDPNGDQSVDSVPLGVSKGMQATYFDETNNILGCKHYQRGAKIKAACCGEYFGCRFCHDESCDHKCNRHMTELMLCMHCNKEQPVAQDCISCNKRLGDYYCSVCRLWDSDPKKSVYHCDKCGLCRIGKGLGKDYFHCDKCGVCMALHLQNNHRCIERNLDCDCPICGEYMFTSTHTVIFMPCGHCIHWQCYQDHIKNSYQCPICWKSLADMTNYFRQIDRMLEQHQMPPEYADFWSIILCNDCEKRSKTKYHFLYHKCQECSSYNTKILQTVQERPTADGAPVISIPIASVMLPTPTGDSPISVRGRSMSSASSMLPDDNEGVSDRDRN